MAAASKKKRTHTASPFAGAPVHTVRVVVRIADPDPRRVDPARFSTVLDRFPGAAAPVRLFVPDQLTGFTAILARANTRNPKRDPLELYRYHVVDCPAGLDPLAVAGALRSAKGVDYAYVQPLAGDPPSAKRVAAEGPVAEQGGVNPPFVAPSNNLRFAEQKYLFGAPGGVDAVYAWAKDGAADGRGIPFVDVEQGWHLDHEDLVAAGITLLPGGRNLLFKEHGTAVLGVVLAVDNCIGCVGIAPHTLLPAVSSVWRQSGTQDPPAALADAILACQRARPAGGGVVLLEIEYDDPANFMRHWPAEWDPAMEVLMEIAAECGITIIEPAGNAEGNGHSLDGDVDQSGRPLARGAPGSVDSGAIMVAGADRTVPHGCLSSNFGSRIDCYAWSDAIVTPWGIQDPIPPYGVFGGTSGASAIIAGVALSVQAMALASPRYQKPFDPWHLRAILSDAANGTPAISPGMGMMPDLRKIITNLAF